MSALPYHKRYHSDALAGFMALTLEERGAYQTLLDMMYDRGGPLIDNERLLAGYMNCSIRKWRMIRDELIAKRKITITRDGLITNPRAEKEIENQSKTHRKLIEAGAKGGRTRAGNEKKGNENSDGKQASLKPASSDPQAIPEARSQKPEVTPKPPSLPADVRSVMEEAGFVSPPPDLAMLKDWYAAANEMFGQTPQQTLDQDILPTVRRVRGQLTRPPFKLKVFDAAIREKLAADQREIEHLRKVQRRLTDDPTSKAFDENRAAGAAG
jgi:uncharacterized protein YdaU (DUF1376 family)